MDMSKLGVIQGSCLVNMKSVGGLPNPLAQEVKSLPPSPNSSETK